MSHVSKFNVGDTVQCSDKNSPHFMDGGVVFEAIIGMSRVYLDMSNKIVAFHNSQLTLISVNKASGSPAVKSTCGIYAGDRVEGPTGQKGTVVQIFVQSNGKSKIKVDCDDGHTRLWDSSDVTPIPGIPSHYQAVVDKDGPNYDSYSDQDIDRREKEKENPFEHTDLGTDLTGDELMESIRSICGR